MVMDIVFLTESEQITSVFGRSAEVTTGPSRFPLSGTNVKAEHHVDYLMHTYIVQ
jgi:hypothetical protein